MGDKIKIPLGLNRQCSAKLDKLKFCCDFTRLFNVLYLLTRWRSSAILSISVSSSSTRLWSCWHVTCLSSRSRLTLIWLSRRAWISGNWKNKWKMNGYWNKMFHNTVILFPFMVFFQVSLELDFCPGRGEGEFVTAQRRQCNIVIALVKTHPHHSHLHHCLSV